MSLRGAHDDDDDGPVLTEVTSPTIELAPPRRQTWSARILGAFMITAGVLHFATPEPFLRIVPPWLPWPAFVVYASGVCELVLGAGVVVERTRRRAALLLMIFYVAIFPANVHMAVNEIQMFAPSVMPSWQMWARLPLQALLVLWAWTVARAARDR